MNLVEVLDLRKTYRSAAKEVVALDGISLQVKDGEFLTIVGPSGCGKSTLIRCIAGLEVPTSGDVFLRGSKATAEPPEKRHIQWLPQTIESTFFPDKSIFFNLGIGLKIQKTPRNEADEKIRTVTSKLGISHLLERVPGDVSGGELQRVAIARALLRDSRIFLLDEPLASLDEIRRRDLRLEFLAIHKMVGGAFIYVTHDQQEALCLGTRCAVMNSGKLEQVSSPEEIYFRPQSLFVARFFSANGLNESPCELKGNTSSREVVSNLLSFSLKLDGNVKPKSNCGVLAVRSEDVVVSAGSGNAKARLSLGKWKVSHRQFFGQHTFVKCVKHSDPSITITALDESGRIEGEIELETSLDKVFLFDLETGQSLR